MHLTRIITARAIWLFDLEELNPRGRRTDPILEATKARYQFEQAGPGENNRGFIFKNGTFSATDALIIDSLEVYQDGVVLTTRSDTDDSDLILEDLLAWLCADMRMGVEGFSLIPTRRYLSELVISWPNSSLEGGLGTLLNIKDWIEEAASIEKGSIEAQAIVFGSSEKRNAFTLERKLNEPYSAHKFYSSAAMKTKTHLELLTKVTTMLA